jgi:hypothetical protein
MKAKKSAFVIAHLHNKISEFESMKGCKPDAIIMGTATYHQFDREASTMLVRSDGSPIADASVGRFEGVDLYVANDIDILVECIRFNSICAHKRNKRAAQ